VVDYRWELLVLTKGWSGVEFGAVFFNPGIASITMPAPYRNCTIDGLMPRNYTEY
jgi:hypothetical protein